MILRSTLPGTAGAIWRYARFACRIAGRRGHAYLFASAVLACGIAMSTTIFSLVDAVLLRPLPFRDQAHLRVIWKANPKAGVRLLELSYPELSDLQENVPAFSSVALLPTTLYGYGKVLQRAGERPVQLESAPVSHGFFATLGVHPFLGSDFSAADEHPGAAPVVILSYSAWQRELHASRDIVGHQVVLNGSGYTVIGVMPRELEFPRGVDLWAPLGVDSDLQNRRFTFLQAIARVKPGFTDDAVNAQVNLLFQRTARQYAAFYTSAQQGVVTPLADYWAGTTRPQLLFSLGASLLLLLSAFSTAANLFLSRTVARAQEIATRLSLGASSAQLVLQFLTEAALAGIFAALSGTALAWALIHLLVRLAPPEIPRLAEASLEGSALAFAVCVALAASLVCAVVPAWMALQTNLEAVLRDRGGRSSGARRGRRLQNGFTSAQIAVTVLLLSAALLVVLSVRAMLRTDTGFRNGATLTMNLAPRGVEYDDEHRTLFYRHVLDRLHSSPTVIEAGGVLVRPFEGTIGWDFHYRADFNASQRPDELPVANFEVVTPGYLRAVGTPLLEGRDFNNNDTAGSPDVVMINRSLAAKFRALGQTPIGRELWLGQDRSDPPWKIVGVTADTHYRGLGNNIDDIYVCYLQSGIPVNYLAVRGRVPARELAAVVNRAIAAVDPAQVAAHVATVDELADRDTARERFNMTLLVTFGLSALGLAGAGVYSVVNENIATRTREIAIRLALGAPPQQIVRSMASSSLAWVLIGELAGLLIFVTFWQPISAMLFESANSAPAVLFGVLVFLLSIAIVAAWLPSHAAARRNPAAILQD